MHYHLWFNRRKDWPMIVDYCHQREYWIQNPDFKSDNSKFHILSMLIRKESKRRKRECHKRTKEGSWYSRVWVRTSRSGSSDEKMSKSTSKMELPEWGMPTLDGWDSANNLVQVWIIRRDFRCKRLRNRSTLRVLWKIWVWRLQYFCNRKR